VKRTSKKAESSTPEQGRISAAIVELLRRQVADRGLVVWYDPQKAYEHLAAQLAIADCTLLRYEDGFFPLREQLEPFLECVNENGVLKADADIAPRVVVYVPLARADTAYALIEAETAGVVVEPDAATLERNSRLSRIVEEVFKEVAPAKAAQLARQADDGLLTVEELDRMAGEAGSVAAGALQIVFGRVSAEEILLQFAARERNDAALKAKSATPEVLTLIRSELGLEIPATEDYPAVRETLSRYMLLSDLLLGMPEERRPEALSGMAMPQTLSQRDIINRISRHWRNRTDLKEAYAEAAERIESDLGLLRMAWPAEVLKDSETFPFTELLLLNHAVGLFLRGDAAAASEWAAYRAGRFWAREQPVWQLAWRVVESAGALLQTAERVRSMLRRRKWTLDELIDAYALHADPWMRLDRLARDLESRHARWEMTVVEMEVFEPLMARARETYAATAGLLAEAYTNALRQAGFSSTRHIGHVGLFHSQVLPELQIEGKVAYFLVDALRYEMAVELIDGLKTEFDAQIVPVVGCLPGITRLGMAALMPYARDGLHLEPGKDGVEVKIHGTTVTGRAQRLEWLTANAGVPVCCTKLSDALKPAFQRRKDFASAKLVVVTSQEIDLLGEEGDEEGMRVYLADVLEKLRRAVRVLVKAGVRRFVIAADHGFVYAPGVDPGLTMDAPGGKTGELHPRVWMGEGGASGDGFFRVKASDLTLQGPLELAFPLGMGSFRVKGGGAAYFHGGVSPAENILPVVRLTPIVVSVPAVDAGVRLTMSKPMITNRLFSVSVEMKTEGLFAEEGRRLRFELVSGQQEAGRAATAAYGFEDGTGEVMVKTGQPNVVTFMLNADAGQTITIRALDCRSQVVLDSLKDVPVKLGI
jgi:hypothetical protein